MRIPYRPHSFTKVKQPPRYIIIHDTGKDVLPEPEMSVDNQKYQVGKLRAQNMVINGEFDLDYHYVVDRINDDYEAVVCRPLNALCEYDDIKSQYNAAIHVAVIGNYDYDIPQERLYQCLAYRVIGPLLWMFKLDKSRILLHSEVATSEFGCPGSNFDKQRLISYVKTLVIPR
jgi:hypothetical protein